MVNFWTCLIYILYNISIDPSAVADLALELLPPLHALLPRLTLAMAPVRKGKTLQVISLILARPPRGESYVAKVNAIESNKRQLKILEAQQQGSASAESLPEVKSAHFFFYTR